MISLSQLPLIFHRRQNQSWETQTFWQCFKQWWVALTEFHQSQQIIIPDTVLHNSNVRNSNKNPFQRTFPWAPFSKLLGSSMTEEPVCTYFQLNSYNQLNTQLFLAESQGHRHGFCPRALGKPQSQKESHFLPPELLFHSSALARSLLGPMLSCLIFRSSHIP